MPYFSLLREKSRKSIRKSMICRWKIQEKFFVEITKYMNLYYLWMRIPKNKREIFVNLNLFRICDENTNQGRMKKMIDIIEWRKKNELRICDKLKYVQFLIKKRNCHEQFPY